MWPGSSEVCPMVASMWASINSNGRVAETTSTQVQEASRRLQETFTGCHCCQRFSKQPRNTLFVSCHRRRKWHLRQGVFTSLGYTTWVSLHECRVSCVRVKILCKAYIVLTSTTFLFTYIELLLTCGVLICLIFSHCFIRFQSRYIRAIRKCLVSQF